MHAMKLKIAVAMLGGALSLGFLGGSAVADPLKVRVGWANMPGHMIPVLFSKPEILKHYGESYTVEPIKFAGTSAMVAALAADQIDASVMSPGAMALASINAGLDLTMFADNQQDGEGHVQTYFLVKKDSGINSPADLKGKRVATNVQGSAMDVSLRIMLTKAGLDPSRDVSIVEVPFASAPEMLKEGKVDFAMLVQPFARPALESGDYKQLTNQSDVYGGLIQVTFLAAKHDWLDANRAAMADFTEDYVRAMRWFINPDNRTEALKIIADYMNVPVEKVSIQFTKDDFVRDPWGVPRVDGVQRVIDGARSIGFISQDYKIAPDHVDLSLVEEARRRIEQ